MKIYSEKKCSQVVSACIDQYPDAMRMPVLECWKKYKLLSCIIVLLLSVMLGVATVKTYKDVALFVKNTFSCWRLMVLVIGFLTIIVIETLCICIHEFIHMLGFKIFCCKSVLVYTKKTFTFSVLGIGWLTKKQVLIITVLPFLTISAVSFLVSIITESGLLLAWLLLINLALSSSDIVCMFVIAKIPSNSLVFGHYYRRQQ